MNKATIKALRVEANHCRDYGRPLGGVIVLVSMPGSPAPEQESDPNTLLSDEAGKLFLGFSDDGERPRPKAPVIPVSVLNGLRWVRDQVAKRRLTLPAYNPDLLDVAIKAFQDLEESLGKTCDMLYAEEERNRTPKQQAATGKGTN